MAKQTGLSDLYIRNLKPAKEVYKSRREKGLFLLVMPSGSKRWYFGYYRPDNGKERALSLDGEYPRVSLAQARALRDEARLLVRKGVDPAAQRDGTRRRNTPPAGPVPSEGTAIAPDSFKWWAEDWYAAKAPSWARSTADKVRSYLDSDLYPSLAGRPIKAIEPQELVDVLAKIEKREAWDIAKKVRGWLYNIFRRAVVVRAISANPAADLIVMAQKPPPGRNHPHVPESELPALLLAIDGYTGSYETKNAMIVQMLTAARPIELRGMAWNQLDLERAVWHRPAELMKRRAKGKLKEAKPHDVPLPRQAVELLNAMKIVTGHRELVFASPRTQMAGRRARERADRKAPISENTINSALARMGFKGRQSSHGFRHVFSTVMNERKTELGFDKDWIEFQLAHIDQNTIRGTYNKAEYLEPRRRMMQWWADHLDQLREEERRRRLFPT